MLNKISKITASTLLATSLLSGAAFAQGGGYQWHQDVASTPSPAVHSDGAVAGVSANALYTVQVGKTASSAAPQYGSGAIAAVHPNWIYKVQNGTL